jgi:hypothetical protein
LGSFRNLKFGRWWDNPKGEVGFVSQIAILAQNGRWLASIDFDISDVLHETSTIQNVPARGHFPGWTRGRNLFDRDNLTTPWLSAVAGCFSCRERQTIRGKAATPRHSAAACLCHSTALGAEMREWT